MNDGPDLGELALGLRLLDDFNIPGMADSVEGFLHFEGNFSDNFNAFAEASVNS